MKNDKEDDGQDDLRRSRAAQIHVLCFLTIQNTLPGARAQERVATRGRGKPSQALWLKLPFVYRVSRTNFCYRLRASSSRRPTSGSAVVTVVQGGSLGLIGVYKSLRIQFELANFQFRISGRSSPHLSMYCLCSMSLSLSSCLK
jgi:hypothetical protein